MFIEINKITNEGLVEKDSIALDDDLLVEKDSYFLENVNYRIVFSKKENKIQAKGNIQTSLSLQCMRCLDTYDFKINSKFDIIFFPIGMISALNKNLNSEDMEYVFYKNDRIDLTRVLIEQINLVIPYKPLCKESCKGICPNCGKNLNYDDCKCEKSEDDINLYKGLKR